MRLFFIPILFLLIIKTSYSQTLTSSDSATESTNASRNDSTKVRNAGTVQTQKEYFRKVDIKVLPPKAKNASILIIKKSQILLAPNSKAIQQIIPDTIGTWKAPLYISLATGKYDLIASKKGFRQKLKKIEISEKEGNNYSIEMISFARIHRVKEEWTIIKWIFAAVAAGAGIASYYFHNKINTLAKEYYNGISPEELNSKKDLINKTRSYYRFSSGLAFSALGGYSISWIIQISF